MADYLKGSSTVLSVGFESAYGTPDFTNGYKVPFAPTLNASGTQAINKSSVISGSASPTQPFLGYKDSQFSGSFVMDTKAFPLFLKGLFGNPTTADLGGGLYKHTFKIGLTIPSMWCELEHEDVSGGLIYTTTGIGLNEMSFSLGGDGELLVNITGIAKDTTKSTTTAITTLNDYTDGVQFQQFQAGVTGATQVKTFDMNYSNTIDSDTYVIDGTATRGGIPKGIADVNGSFGVYMADDSIFNDARNFTTMPLDITLTSGTSIAKFIMQETKLDAMTNTSIESPSTILANFNFQAYYKSGANETALQVEITNDQSTIGA